MTGKRTMSAPFCKITAYLRPFGWENVADALIAAGAPGMTAVEAAGAGEAGNKMLPRIALEIVAEKEQAPALLGVLREEMFTGEKGDGKITVAPVEQAIRISTGESGGAAI